MSNANGNSAVFSNLAKAAEKQQLLRASELFGTLSEYYADTDPQEAGLADLKSLVSEDIEVYYPAVNELAGPEGDRGSLRAARWGEKVTKIQRGLVGRYETKGEDLIGDQQLYVCEACGFIYLGETAPDICPVCKAPSSRFAIIK